MPPVVHYWADLQSMHELCCYGNIMRTQNVSEYMLVLALCLVSTLVMQVAHAWLSSLVWTSVKFIHSSSRLFT